MKLNGPICTQLDCFLSAGYAKITLDTINLHDSDRYVNVYHAHYKYYVFILMQHVNMHKLAHKYALCTHTICKQVSFGGEHRSGVHGNMSKIGSVKLFSSRLTDQQTNQLMTGWFIFLHLIFHVYLPNFNKNCQAILI